MESKSDSERDPADPAGHLRLSRRRLLGAAGITGASFVLGAVTATVIDQAGASAAATASAAIPFHGEHQAGIATPAQDRLVFAAFDVTTSNVADLRELLKTWTQASVAMTAGKPVADDVANPQAPPKDTGEAAGLLPAQLTITVGFGPSLFDARFGLGSRRPAALVDLPHFRGENLVAARSRGDLSIQACANDPQVAFHAIRNLARLARGAAALKWTQLGFGRTSSTSTGQDTARNLMGFKDGTNNIKAEDAAAMRQFVWADSSSDQAWMTGGSFQVARRINMRIETWDRDYLQDQENVIGREKASGAPLGARRESDPVDLERRGSDGDPLIPMDSHIRLAAPSQNGGLRILRRGYSFTDGIDPLTGNLDAGLFFIAYQRDPRIQFIPLQTRLAASDGLNEYIVHTSSAIFACPGGVSPGGSWGDAIFAGA